MRGCCSAASAGLADFCGRADAIAHGNSKSSESGRHENMENMLARDFEELMTSAQRQINRWEALARDGVGKNNGPFPARRGLALTNE